MRQNFIVAVLTSALAIGSCLPPLAARAQEPPPVVSAVDVLQAARTLWQQLQDQGNAAQAKPHKAVVVGSLSAPLTITLGLWDDTAGTYELVQVRKAGKNITTLGKSPHQFTLKRSNGVNSEFQVVGEPNLHVLAVTYPVLTSIGTTRHPKYRVDDVAYVPYTAYLNRSEIVAAGRAYLDRNVSAVYDELTALGVRSRAFPDRSLAVTVSPEVVKAILAIEHIGGQGIAADNVDDYLNVFHVTLAANQNLAFAYARSTASARGLVQFIRGTYLGLARSRPALGLNLNFEQGMADPYNAIKAEVALLDLSLTSLPAEARTRNLNDEGAIGAYLAAAYNGGTVRVRRAIRQWGEAWAEDHTKALVSLKSQLATAKLQLKAKQRALKAATTVKARRPLQQATSDLQAKVTSLTQQYTLGSAAKLKAETVQYVAKFKVVYAYFAGPLHEATVPTIPAS